MTGPEQHANTVERLAEEIRESAAILYGNTDIRFSGSEEARLELKAALDPLVALARDRMVVTAEAEELMDAIRRAEAAEERADTLERELGEWQERCFLTYADARAEADRLRQALEQALDCKGSYNGTVSERGGDPAICTRCEEAARAALAGPQTKEQHDFPADYTGWRPLP